MLRLGLAVVLSAACVLAQNNYYNHYGPTTTPRPYNYHPPAPVHYVAIGQQLDGDYKFGYDTGKGPLGQSFREETRLPDGTVKGAYGYVDANGQQRIIRYTAGKDGFSAEGDGVPQAPPAAPAPAAAPYVPPQPQAPQHHHHHHHHPSSAVVAIHRPQQQRYRYEDENHGPAYIDTSLLSYNIGVSHQG